MIERNTAYGMSVVPRPGKEGHFTVILTALKDRQVRHTCKVEPNYEEYGCSNMRWIIIQIEIWVDEDGLHAVTEVDNMECELLHIDVNLKSNWMGVPKVQFIDLHGVQLTESERLPKVERITEK